jgi:hypothetical protein
MDRQNRLLNKLGPCLVEERSALVSDAGKDLRLGASLLARINPTDEEIEHG